MAHTQALHPVSRTFHSIPFVELQRSFPSEIRAISPFIDQLMRFILNFRNRDGSEIEIEVALREALANAVVHGNGQNCRKRVYVGCRCYVDGEVSIMVWDEGRGFDRNTLPDPTTPENLLFTHGRGIYLMKTLMDEVSFEGGGTAVHMRKKSNVASAAQRKAG
jgi:serine/threonine-protein kinase RsbW